MEDYYCCCKENLSYLHCVFSYKYIDAQFRFLHELILAREKQIKKNDTDLVLSCDNIFISLVG